MLPHVGYATQAKQISHVDSGSSCGTAGINQPSVNLSCRAVVALPRAEPKFRTKPRATSSEQRSSTRHDGSGCPSKIATSSLLPRRLTTDEWNSTLSMGAAA